MSKPRIETVTMRCHDRKGYPTIRDGKRIQVKVTPKFLIEYRPGKLDYYGRPWRGERFDRKTGYWKYPKGMFPNYTVRIDPADLARINGGESE